MKLVKKNGQFFTYIPRSVRARIIVVTSFLCSINVIIWITAFVVSRSYPSLLGLCILAYGFGLRHAVDADHIAAIDNTTRKLMTDGKKPVTVGLFFSLGHSTVVVIVSLLIAVASSVIKVSLPAYASIGWVIGTTLSSIFLCIIGFINLTAFYNIVRTFKRVKKGSTRKIQTGGVSVTGPMQKIFNVVLRSVTKSWQMYFIGFLFGLGFDTATEVGLLSMTALTSTTGISLYTIMLLPFAFTAGMTLIDTLDGIIMLGAYGWAAVKPERKLYYNLHITLLSVVIALGIGFIQLLSVVTSAFSHQNSIFRFITAITFENSGYWIIGVFLLSWLLSYGIYKYSRYDK